MFGEIIVQKQLTLDTNGARHLEIPAKASGAPGRADLIDCTPQMGHAVNICLSINESHTAESIVQLG